MNAHEKSGESGNVLFLIIIAVALFAALSYVVTTSSRSSAGSVSDDKLRLVASQLVQNGVGLRTTVVRMIMQGHKPDELDFWWDESPHAVFGAAGGGTRLRAPDLESYGVLGSGDYFYHALQPSSSPVAITDLGTSAPEIVMALTLGITPQAKRLCETINRQLGIDGIPGSVTYADWNKAAPGQAVACVQNYTNFYLFYFVAYET